MKKLLVVAVIVLGIVAYFQLRPADVRDDIRLQLQVTTAGGRQYDTRTGEITHEPIDLYLSGKIINLGKHRFPTVVIGVRIPSLNIPHQDTVEVGPLGPTDELVVDECIARNVQVTGLGSGPLCETSVIRVEIAPDSE